MAGRRVRITAQSCQGRPCRSQWTYETIASSTTSAAGKVPVQTSPERIATQRARTTAPAVRYFGNYLRAREAVDGFEELAALLGGDFGVARLERARDAVVHVLVEDLERDALESGRGGRDLREDVDAVALVLDHPLDSAHLSLDSVQPLDERVLLFHVSVCHVPSLGLEKRRSRRLFVTTKTLENAIAPAATIGLRSPATASGIAATL